MSGSALKTVGEVFGLATGFLQKSGVPSPRREAEDLIASVLGLSRLDFYMSLERPLIEAELAAIRPLLARRGKGEPFVYLMGKISFMGLDLKVTPDVLIPRQETELLVDMISKELRSIDMEGKVLWDVCCGSGAIGLSLKKIFPKLNVELSDICPRAVQVSLENSLRNHLQVRVNQGDLLAPFSEKKADFFTCNPPYIRTKDMQTLQRDVKDHEPHLALDGGEEGLDFYYRLEKELPSRLNPGAKVYFEIGNDQGESVKQIFSSSIWKKKEFKNDLAGHNRFFLLEIE